MRCLWLGALLTTACNAIAGLGDLSFEPAGSGGGAGQAETGGGGDAGSGGSVEAPCGSIGALADDFEGLNTSDTWTILASGGADAQQAGGDVVVTVPASSTACATYASRFRYDLRGGEVRVGVPLAIEPGVGAGLLVRGQTDEIEIGHRPDGSLRSRFTQGGNDSEPSEVAYDPAAHRHWRIRETAGTVYWETSADGDSWVEQAARATEELFQLDHVQVMIGACSTAALPSATSVHFDELRGFPDAELCLAETLTDDFDDNVIDAKWGRSFSQSGGIGGETSGQLVVNLPDAMPGALYQHTTAHAFDLRGSHVALELASSLIGAAGRIWLEVDRYDPALDLERYIGFEIEGGSLECKYDTGGGVTILLDLPYSAQAHRWLRLREGGGTFFFEASPDGVSWEVLVGAPSPMSVDQVDIEIGAYRPEASPALSAAWDNLNIAR